MEKLSSLSSLSLLIHDIQQLNRSLLFLFIVLFSTHLHGQTNEKGSEVYSPFDMLVGEENMELYNGPVYFNAHEHSPNSHQYFISEDFMTGDVVFKLQPYFQQNIKYNTFLDEIVITPKYNASGLVVKLIREHVNAFTIEGHHFINLLDKDSQMESKGYYEVLEEDEENMLLKKYRKKRNKSRNEDLVIIEYNQDTDYYLWHKGKLEKVNSIGRWKSEFPGQKKNINQIFRDLKRTYRSDKDEFFKILFNELKTPAQS